MDVIAGEESIRHAIVRMTTAEGATVGTGFIVDLDRRLIVTCAHVIEDCASGPGSTVSFHTLIDGEDVLLSAEVPIEWWRPSDERDLAVIRAKSLPSRASKFELGYSRNLPRKTFETYGFPEAKKVHGLPGRCEILNETRENGSDVYAMRSGEISSGFSGGPVWDFDSGLIVGVVVSRVANASFMIPVEAVYDVVPELRPRTPCPYIGLQPFDVDRSDEYFGRDRAIEELLDVLTETDLATVVGVSGSGKSSFVRAGLARGIADTGHPELQNRVLAVVEVGVDPAATLVSRVRAARGLMNAEGFADAQAGAEIVKAVQRPTVLVIDQLERIFTESSNETQRTSCLDFIISLSTETVKVVTAVRSDFYPFLLEHATYAKS